MADGARSAEMAQPRPTGGVSRAGARAAGGTANKAEVLPLSARKGADRVSTASPRSEDSLSKVWLARPVMLRCLSLIRRLLCF